MLVGYGGGQSICGSKSHALGSTSSRFGSLVLLIALAVAEPGLFIRDLDGVMGLVLLLTIGLLFGGRSAWIGLTLCSAGMAVFAFLWIIRDPQNFKYQSYFVGFLLASVAFGLAARSKIISRSRDPVS